MIKNLIHDAQGGNKESMLQLINKFDPLLKKYANKLGHEDAYENLLLSFIELITTMKLEHFSRTDDCIFVSYIQISIINRYKKFLENMIKEKKVMCLTELSDEQRYCMDIKLSKCDEQNILFELDAANILSKKEYEIICMIYFNGYNSAEIAKKTNKTRQSINQIKQRALKKLKHSLETKNNYSC